MSDREITEQQRVVAAMICLIGCTNHTERCEILSDEFNPAEASIVSKTLADFFFRTPSDSFSASKELLKS